MADAADETAGSSVDADKQETKSAAGGKQRLAKQAEVEMLDEGDAARPVEQLADNGEDQSPNSDESDRTVVETTGGPMSSSPADRSSSSSSPEQTDVQFDSSQKSADTVSKTSPTQVGSIKTRLVRSRAVCDDIAETLAQCSTGTVTLTVCDDTEVSCADTSVSPADVNLTSSATVTLTLSPSTVAKRSDHRRKLAHDSSQGSTVSDSGTSPALSRDSSFETAYTDSTGTNLQQFITKTLNKNRSDRSMLLHLETELINFIQDTRQEKYKFPQMSSYHRMLVHRVAAFFGLEHNVDESGKAVIVNRCSSTRIPEFKFRDQIVDEVSGHEEQPKKLILRRHRDCTSLEDNRASDRVTVDDRKSKSFEEREEIYVEARNRIFHQTQQHQQQQQQQQHSHSLLSVSQIGSSFSRSLSRPSTLLTDSREDVETAGGGAGDMRQWSSTDSSGYSTDGSARLRVNVTKASSFHGVTVLSRTDTGVTSTACYVISKTDSVGSSGTSNLSSPGVLQQHRTSLVESIGSDVSSMSLSQSEDIVPQPSGSPFLPFTGEHGEPLAIWVASSIEKIPAGSLIINPQTGKPYLNPDGSVYRWYPPVTAVPSPVEPSKAVGPLVQQPPRPSSQPIAASSIRPSLVAVTQLVPPPAAGQFVYQPTPALPYHVIGPELSLQPAGITYQLMTGAASAAPGPAVQLVHDVYGMPHHSAYDMHPGSTHPHQPPQPHPHPHPHPVSATDPSYHHVVHPAPASDLSSYSGYDVQQSPPVSASTPSASVAGRPALYEDSPAAAAAAEFYSPQSAVLVTSLHPPARPTLRHPVPVIIHGEARYAGTPTQHLHVQHAAPAFPQSLSKHRLPSSSLPGIYPAQPAAAAAVASQSADSLVSQPYLAGSATSQAYLPGSSRGSPAPAGSVQLGTTTWSAPLSTRGSNVLEVCGLPPGLLCSQLDTYLSDLIVCFSVRRFDILRCDGWSTVAADTVDGCSVLAVFDSDDAALTALTAQSSANYRLQPYPG